MMEKDRPSEFWSKKVFSERYQKTNSFLSFAPGKLSLFSDMMMSKMSRFQTKTAIFDEDQLDAAANKRGKKGKKKAPKKLARKASSRSPTKRGNKSSLPSSQTKGLKPGGGSPWRSPEGSSDEDQNVNEEKTK